MQRNHLIDFDDWMPSDMRNTVLSSDVCQKYLAERERIGALAANLLANGGTLSDKALQEELRGLNTLIEQLKAIIAEASATSE